MTNNPYRQADHWSRKARAEGYPARSVFKLEEIDRRVHLLHAGARVLDLGAAPGSWTLYASQRVGPRGVVCALDQAPLRMPVPAGVTFLQVDVLHLDAGALDLWQPFDVVLSDMAPATTGASTTDHQRSAALVACAIELADKTTRVGSSLVTKLFMGPELDSLLSEFKRRYQTTRVIRPSGTRSRSKEVFLVGTGRRLAT